MKGIIGIVKQITSGERAGAFDDDVLLLDGSVKQPPLDIWFVAEVVARYVALTVSCWLAISVGEWVLGVGPETPIFSAPGLLATALLVAWLVAVAPLCFCWPWQRKNSDAPKPSASDPA